jgi:hypothetical protein
VASADPNFDWEYWMNLPSPPRKGPALPKEVGQASKSQVEHTQQSNPELSPGSVLDMSHKADDMFDVDDLLHHLKDSPPSPEPNPLATAARPVNPETSSLLVGPSNSRLPASPGSPEELDYELVRGPPEEFDYELIHGPPTSPELTDPGLHSDHQSSSKDSQQVDLLAAIYGAKGKAKESRHIPGPGRDVGNAAQRELQPG